MSQRSDFVSGQMTHWVETVSLAGRAEHLFELEMWLKSFERYFRVSNQPQKENSNRSLALRSFYEEVGLVANAISRVTELCTFLSSEDQVNLERFDKYVENYLREDDIVDPYIARLLRQNSPQAGLTLLRESFEDLQLVLAELTKLSRIPYGTFQSVGRLIYREIRRNDYLKMLMEKKFKPAYDRMRAEPISELIHAIRDRRTRRLVAKAFLELFRLLHYLEYADPHKRKFEELRTTVLIFSLIAAETRTLLDFVRRQSGQYEEDSPLQETLHGFIYCIPLELRKVFSTELTDISAFKQIDAVYMRIENSHGILRDCFQQSVVQLAQVFDEKIKGGDIFGHFATRLQQSLTVREELMRLLASVRRFEKTRDSESSRLMKALATRFYDRYLRYLMYRDWKGFEAFCAEMLKCQNTTGLVQISHRFSTYLRTLLQEISKRNVLQDTASEQD